jgi:hypothetical protein
MPSQPPSRPVFSLILFLSCFCSAQFAHGQGFSGKFGSKMDVILNRKRPPQVYIIGDAISVQVSSKVPTGSQYCNPLASMLESALIDQNRHLRPEHSKPETIISLEITQLVSKEGWEERRYKRQKKTGERQVWNAKKQKYDSKDVYEEVEVRENYKVVGGSITVSYQVKDVRTGAMLDSRNFPAFYNQSFLDGNGAPALSEVENMLVRRIVGSVVPRLVPTVEPVKVLLAQGKLKDIAKYGEAELWQRMVEAFEEMTPLKDPKDDSYRTYNIAVGYEALAYKADDIATTRRLLDKAAALYGQAYDAKPNEKYYREPQLRIEQAITQYRKLDDQLTAYNSAKSLPQQQFAQSPPQQKGGNGQRNQGVGQPRPGQTAPAPLTNQQIIDLASKGMDEANLIATIRDAKEVAFDLSARGLGELLQNKVSNRIIAVMRARQTAAQRTPQTRRPRAKRNHQ